MIRFVFTPRPIFLRPRSAWQGCVGKFGESSVMAVDYAFSEEALEGEYAHSCYCQDACAQCDASDGSTLAIKKGAGALPVSCGTGLVCDSDGANTACVSTLAPWESKMPGVLDLATTDGDLTGCLGGFASGEHGYLVPNANGKVVRFDLATFTQVAVLDLPTVANDGDLKGFRGGFASGEHGYLVPNYTGNKHFGKAVRFDLATFTQVTVLDLPTVANDGELAGFEGGFASGEHGYLVPQYNGNDQFGKVVRFDLATFTQVAVLDLPTVANDGDLNGFGGGFASGEHGYLVPRSIGKAVRFDVIDTEPGPNIGDVWGAGVLDSFGSLENNCPVLPFAGAPQEEQVATS